MRARIAIVAALAAALPLAALLLTALALPSGAPGGAPLAADSRDHGPMALGLPGAVPLPPMVPAPTTPASAGARDVPGLGTVAASSPREAPASAPAEPSTEAGSASGKGLLRVVVSNNGSSPMVVAVRLLDEEGLPRSAEVAQVRARSTWVRDHALPLGNYRVEVESVGTQASITADLTACPSHAVRAVAAVQTALGADGVTLATAAYPAVCIGPAEALSWQD